MSKSREFMRDSYFNDIAATAVVGGLSAYFLRNLDFLPNIRESLYNVRHTSNTVKDAVLGGPEGMRAAKNLEDAIFMIESAREANSEAGRALESYFSSRKDFVNQLSFVYKENETFSREVERLKLQLEGALKSTFEIGNQIKPDFMNKIDDMIIRIYGKDVVKAREESANVKEFYKQARKFYDSREKSEHTVKEFCNYLEKVKVESEEQNNRFNELFPGIISQVKEGYETEDIVFSQRRDKDFSKLRISDTRDSIGEFRGNVDETYGEVSQEMPIREYSDKNWVDVATNPAVLGMAVAMIGYAGSRLFLPKMICNPLTKIIASPVTVPLKSVKIASKGIINGAKWALDKLKKPGKSVNSDRTGETK